MRRGGDHAEPRTELERLIAQLWKKLLGVPRVGLHDNFFELGGDSLFAAQLIHRLSQALGVELSVKALFEDPTLGTFSEVVLARRYEQLDVRDAARLLKTLDAMPEQNAKRLL